MNLATREDVYNLASIFLWCLATARHACGGWWNPTRWMHHACVAGQYCKFTHRHTHTPMDQSAACRCRCCCCWLHVYIQYPIQPSTNLAAKSERAKAKPRQDSSTNDEAAFLSPHLPLPAMPCHATPSQLDHDQRPAVRPLMAWKDRRTCSLWSSVLERNSSIVPLSLSHTHTGIAGARDGHGRHGWTWGLEWGIKREGGQRKAAWNVLCLPACLLALWRHRARRSDEIMGWVGAGRGFSWSRSRPCDVRAESVVALLLLEFILLCPFICLLATARSMHGAWWNALHTQCAIMQEGKGVDEWMEERREGSTIALPRQIVDVLFLLMHASIPCHTWPMLKTWAQGPMCAADLSLVLLRLHASVPFQLWTLLWVAHASPFAQAIITTTTLPPPQAYHTHLYLASVCKTNETYQ
jgi:hypothetical protein